MSNPLDELEIPLPPYPVWRGRVSRKPLATLAVASDEKPKAPAVPERLGSMAAAFEKAKIVEKEKTGPEAATELKNATNDAVRWANEYMLPPDLTPLQAQEFELERQKFIDKINEIKERNLAAFGKAEPSAPSEKPAKAQPAAGKKAAPAAKATTPAPAAEGAKEKTVQDEIAYLEGKIANGTDAEKEQAQKALAKYEKFRKPTEEVRNVRTSAEDEVTYFEGLKTKAVQAKDDAEAARLQKIIDDYAPYLKKTAPAPAPAPAEKEKTSATPGRDEYQRRLDAATDPDEIARLSQILADYDKAAGPRGPAPAPAPAAPETVILPVRPIKGGGVVITGQGEGGAEKGFAYEDVQGAQEKIKDATTFDELSEAVRAAGPLLKSKTTGRSHDPEQQVRAIDDYRRTGLRANRITGALGLRGKAEELRAAEQPVAEAAPAQPAVENVPPAPSNEYEKSNREFEERIERIKAIAEKLQTSGKWAKILALQQANEGNDSALENDPELLEIAKAGGPIQYANQNGSAESLDEHIQAVEKFVDWILMQADPDYKGQKALPPSEARGMGTLAYDRIEKKFVESLSPDQQREYNTLQLRDSGVFGRGATTPLSADERLRLEAYRDAFNRRLEEAAALPRSRQAGVRTMRGGPASSPEAAPAAPEQTPPAPPQTPPTPPQGPPQGPPQQPPAPPQGPPTPAGEAAPGLAERRRYNTTSEVVGYLFDKTGLDVATDTFWNKFMANWHDVVGNYYLGPAMRLKGRYDKQVDKAKDLRDKSENASFQFVKDWYATRANKAEGRARMTLAKQSHYDALRKRHENRQADRCRQVADRYDLKLIPHERKLEDLQSQGNQYREAVGRWRDLYRQATEQVARLEVQAQQRGSFGGRIYTAADRKLINEAKKKIKEIQKNADQSDKNLAKTEAAIVREDAKAAPWRVRKENILQFAEHPERPDTTPERSSATPRVARIGQSPVGPRSLGTPETTPAAPNGPTGAETAAERTLTTPWPREQYWNQLKTLLPELGIRNNQLPENFRALSDARIAQLRAQGQNRDLTMREWLDLTQEYFRQVDPRSADVFRRGRKGFEYAAELNQLRPAA